MHPVSLVSPYLRCLLNISLCLPVSPCVSWASLCLLCFRVSTCILCLRSPYAYCVFGFHMHIVSPVSICIQCLWSPMSPVSAKYLPVSPYVSWASLCLLCFRVSTCILCLRSPYAYCVSGLHMHPVSLVSLCLRCLLCLRSLSAGREVWEAARGVSGFAHAAAAAGPSVRRSLSAPHLTAIVPPDTTDLRRVWRDVPSPPGDADWDVPPDTTDGTYRKGVPAPVGRL